MAAHIGLAFHDAAVLRLLVQHCLVLVREHNVRVESLTTNGNRLNKIYVPFVPDTGFLSFPPGTGSVAEAKPAIFEWSRRRNLKTAAAPPKEVKNLTKYFNRSNIFIIYFTWLFLTNLG